MNVKKNLKQEVSKSSDYKVFFFDESRVGTHSKSGHGWFQKSVSSCIKQKLDYRISIYILLQILELEMTSH